MDKDYYCSFCGEVTDLVCDTCGKTLCNQHMGAEVFQRYRKNKPAHYYICVECENDLAKKSARNKKVTNRLITKKPARKKTKTRKAKPVKKKRTVKKERVLRLKNPNPLFFDI